MNELVKLAKGYIEKGVYSPEALFVLLNSDVPRKHYSVIRHAIHIAKSSIYG